MSFPYYFIMSCTPENRGDQFSGAEGALQDAGYGCELTPLSPAWNHSFSIRFPPPSSYDSEENPVYTEDARAWYAGMWMQDATMEGVLQTALVTSELAIIHPIEGDPMNEGFMESIQAALLAAYPPEE